MHHIHETTIALCDDCARFAAGNPPTPDDLDTSDEFTTRWPCPWRVTLPTHPEVNEFSAEICGGCGTRDAGQRTPAVAFIAGPPYRAFERLAERAAELGLDPFEVTDSTDDTVRILRDACVNLDHWLDIADSDGFDVAAELYHRTDGRCVDVGGRWDSLAEWAEETWTDSGRTEGIPEELLPYVDWAAFAAGMEAGGTLLAIDNPGKGGGVIVYSYR